MFAMVDETDKTQLSLQDQKVPHLLFTFCNRKKSLLASVVSQLEFLVIFDFFWKLWIEMKNFKNKCGRVCIGIRYRKALIANEAP